MPKAGSLLDLGPSSAGSISMMGMSLAGTASTTTPFIGVDGFKGTLSYVGNSMGTGYKENDGSFFVRIAGKSSDSRVLCAANEFRSGNSTTVAKTWHDESDPKAHAILLNCIGGAVNQTTYDIPNVVAQAVGLQPDEPVVLDMLSQIRVLRTEPPIKRQEGVTDVKLLRVLIRASQGRNGLVFTR